METGVDPFFNFASCLISTILSGESNDSIFDEMIFMISVSLNIGVSPFGETI